MPRIKKTRLIQMAPHFRGYKPIGLPNKNNTKVFINFEEYEALKLCDYELLTQAEAAVLMNVSRPTFTRVYASVRQKIAKAFVEGSTIIFEGGDNDVVEWYKCNECDTVFTFDKVSDKCCPMCGSKSIIENTIS